MKIMVRSLYIVLHEGVGMQKTLGYIRVSTEKQDLEKQKYIIEEHAKQNHIVIDEIIDIEISSRKSMEDRKIDILINMLNKGDRLIVVELSRLGRNMIETLGIIEKMNNLGVDLIFVRQPELSTTSNNQIQKLILAIYSYFAEAEREFISLRTKQGLQALKAQGKVLGRPKGTSKIHESEFSNYKSEIKKYLNLDLSYKAIWQLISEKMQIAGINTLSYNAFRYYLKHMNKY